MLKKAILFTSVFAAAVYIVLQIIGVSGFELVFYLINAAVIVYAVASSLGGAVRLGDKDALFTGALGLGAIAVSDIYYLAYIAVSDGAVSDINITDYSNAVSYVFFLSALTLLILPPYKWERALHIGVSAVCAVTVIVTTYAIIINSENLLYITVIFTAVCCLALSGAVLYQSFRIRQLRTARIFAYSMLFLGLLDVAVYLSFILGLAVNVQTIFISMYTPLYVWICGGLLRLRKEV